MQAFTLGAPRTLEEAVRAGAAPGARYIAGGTDLLQLWKNQVEAPETVIDLAPLGLRGIEADGGELRIRPLTTMAEAAAHPELQRRCPAVSQALLASASPQVRNMGTVGGNLLQRTRCLYFRDTGFAACNKRSPGSGCAAIGGENRELAIFGGSASCIATHPSDMPVALVAAGASLELTGAAGARRVPLEAFYLLPGERPQDETVLRPGEIVTAVIVPSSEAARHATYVKVRDRQSFAFALVSVAVGLDVQGGRVREARVAAGGVGTRPWRLLPVEEGLRGQVLGPAVIDAASGRAAEGAHPASQNGFKITLLQRTVRRALMTLA